MNTPDSERSDPALRVLFVCTGNTCRSPLAEALTAELRTSLGLSSLEVRSAGTHTRPGQPASIGARRAAGRHGLSLEGHTSASLTRELVEWADRILVMSPSHLDSVRRLGGGEKADLLAAIVLSGNPPEAGEEGNALSVPDPFGGDDEVYEETFLTLERLVREAVERFAREGKE